MIRSGIREVRAAQEAVLRRLRGENADRPRVSNLIY